MVRRDQRHFSTHGAHGQRCALRPRRRRLACPRRADGHPAGWCTPSAWTRKPRDWSSPRARLARTAPSSAARAAVIKVIAGARISAPDEAALIAAGGEIVHTAPHAPGVRVEPEGTPRDGSGDRASLREHRVHHWGRRDHARLPLNGRSPATSTRRGPPPPSSSIRRWTLIASLSRASPPTSWRRGASPGTSTACARWPGSRRARASSRSTASRWAPASPHPRRRSLR